jgi:hypothetical protein
MAGEGDNVVHPLGSGPIKSDINASWSRSWEMNVEVVLQDLQNVEWVPRFSGTWDLHTTLLSMNSSCSD